jgi:hypothetical protein
MNFKDILWEKEAALIEMKMNHYFLKAFDDRMRRLTRGKPFKLKNDIVRRLIYNNWHMLVIDLGSFSKGMLGKGGFFNQLKANLHCLPIVRHDEFIRLVPSANGRKPLKLTAQDVDSMKEIFSAITEDIESDRDNNRAHRHENLKAEVTLELDFRQIDERFNAIETFMNSLKTIFQDFNMKYMDMNKSDVHSTADEMIQLMLWDTAKQTDPITRIPEYVGEKYSHTFSISDAEINRMHEIHDGIKSGVLNYKDFGLRAFQVSNLCFNEVARPAKKADSESCEPEE